MQLQFVYGNPKKVSQKRKKKARRRKKLLASGRKIKNNKPDKGAPVAKKRKKKRSKSLKAKTKKTKHAKKHARKKVKRVKAKKSKARKVVRRSKRKKNKNPERMKFSAKNAKTGETIKNRYSKPRPTYGELAEVKAKSKLEIARAKKAKEYAHGKKKKVKKKIKAAANRRIDRSNKILDKVRTVDKARRASIKDDKQMRAGLTAAGFKIRGSKEVGKRLGKKRKSKSKSKSTKRNPIYGGGNMVDVVKRAVTGGMDKYELGALALGGALYPITSAGLAKFLPGVYGKISRLNIPGGAGVGVNFLVGALAYAIGEKIQNKAAQSVGKGLIAAAAVGVAAVAGQYVAKAANLVPGVAPLAELPTGYGDGTDFGSGSDFGAIDYTMEGIDYTMEGGQMGDGTDFGDVEYSADDSYDGVPEGMGEGQMG